MKQSTDRILVTHVGSLARPDDLWKMLNAKLEGQPCGQKGLLNVDVLERHLEIFHIRLDGGLPYILKRCIAVKNPRVQPATGFT